MFLPQRIILTPPSAHSDMPFHISRTI